MAQNSESNEERQPPKITQGGTAAMHLVSSTLVGMAMGYGIDLLTGTKPLFMIVMLFVGFAAGMYKLYQAMQVEQQNLSNKD